MNAAQTAPSAHKKPFIAKGHDRQLGDVQSNRLNVVVLTIGGETHVGKIVYRDKYTITVDTGADQLQLIYKHAIESISLPRKVQ